jgi:hypothetical protein
MRLWAHAPPRVVRLRDDRLVVNAGSAGCPGYDGAKPVYRKVQTGTPDMRD